MQLIFSVERMMCCPECCTDPESDGCCEDGLEDSNLELDQHYPWQVELHQPPQEERLVLFEIVEHGGAKAT